MNRTLPEELQSTLEQVRRVLAYPPLDADHLRDLLPLLRRAEVCLRDREPSGPALQLADGLGHLRHRLRRLETLAAEWQEQPTPELGRRLFRHYALAEHEWFRAARAFGGWRRYVRARVRAAADERARRMLEGKADA